jgi:hypothetical protein
MASRDEGRPEQHGAGPASPVDDGEALLLAHAADCPTCRPIAARYQVLRQAIRAWRQPPVPPADLVERILSAPDDLSPATWGAARRARRIGRDHPPHVRLLSGLAAAMVGCMVLGFAYERFIRPARQDRLAAMPGVSGRDGHRISGPREATPESRDLNRALFEATSATWDLARSASEPAARISRDVLDATAQTESQPRGSPSAAAAAAATTNEDLAGLSVSMPSLDPLTPDATAASTVLQQVGDHLSAGVRPLSSTARQAFGFLLGPPGDRTEPRTTGPAASGA